MYMHAAPDNVSPRHWILKVDRPGGDSLVIAIMSLVTPCFCAKYMTDLSP